MIVILHGWSDTSKSFERFARSLREMGLADNIRHIQLGDYVSMDDDVTYDDLAHAMRDAWVHHRLPTERRSADLVVHSTGALVARHWLTQFHSAESNPIHRFLMLAPANFGSHLAHKGRSFLGRVIKGFRSGRRFHTGANLLKGLELASPFSWKLAFADRFVDDEAWYGPGRILGTALVGSSGYTSISAAANEVGSDGTVLVASANLQPLCVEMDFASDPSKPEISYRQSVGDVAFCRIPGENHSTVAWKDRGPVNGMTPDLVREALTVDDRGFDRHVENLAIISGQQRAIDLGRPYSQGYQNTIIRVTDDHGADVEDYFIEAFAKRTGANTVDAALTRRIQEEVMVHAHKPNFAPAFRALRFNCDVMRSLLVEPSKPLYMSLTAQPDIGTTKSVGYRTVEYMDIGSIKIDPQNIGKLFQPDRTALINLKIRREAVADLVRFKAATAG